MMANFSDSNLSNLDVPNSVDFFEFNEELNDGVDAWFDTRQPTPAARFQKNLRRRSNLKKHPLNIPDSPQKENIPPHSSTPVVTPGPSNSRRRSDRFSAGVATPGVGSSSLYPATTPGKVLNTTHTILPSLDEEQQESDNRKTMVAQESANFVEMTPTHCDEPCGSTPAAESGAKTYDLRRFTESGHPVRRSSIVNEQPVDYHEPTPSSTLKPRLQARRSRRRTIPIIIPEKNQEEHTDNQAANLISPPPSVENAETEAISIPDSPAASSEAVQNEGVRIVSVRASVRRSIPSVSSAFEDVASPIIRPIFSNFQRPIGAAVSEMSSPSVAVVCPNAHAVPSSNNNQAEARITGNRTEPTSTTSVMEELRHLTVAQTKPAKSNRLMDKKHIKERIKARQVTPTREERSVAGGPAISALPPVGQPAAQSAADATGAAGGIAAALKRFRSRAVAVVSPHSVRKKIQKNPVVADHSLIGRGKATTTTSGHLDPACSSNRSQPGGSATGAPLDFGAGSPSKKPKKSGKKPRSPVIKTWELPPKLPAMKRRPSTVAKPFHLETEERGRVKQAMFKEKVEQMEKQTAEKRSFHASGTPTILRKRPWTPQKVEQPPVEFNPFSLHITERLELRHQFESMVAKHLDDKAKEVAALKEKQEKDEREELRKKTNFKAQPVRYKTVYRESRAHAAYELRRPAKK